ncbi:MAG: ABC transporter permease [Solirubrobacteraceae bacterium]|nr:ABC transporter permease [Solirubrobacteraceae bacterium]
MSTAAFSPYLRLELKRTIRNPRAILFTAAIPLMMYVLFSSTGSGGPDTPLEVHRAVLASMVAYGAIGGALLASGPPLATERATGWLRQLSATPLPANAAVIAKIAVCLTLSAFGAAIVGTVGAVTGAHLGIGTLVLLVVAMTLGAVCFGMLGLIYGASIKRPDTAQGATILTYLTMSAIGGLWVPSDQFPAWLESISKVLPSHAVLEIGNAIVEGSAAPGGAIALLLVWTVVLAGIASVAWKRGIRAR